MKQRQSIQGSKRIISMLIAMMMVVTTILPSVTVSYAGEGEGSETVMDVPQEEAAAEYAGEDNVPGDEGEDSENYDNGAWTDEAQDSETGDNTASESAGAGETYKEQEMPMNEEAAEEYDDTASENGEDNEAEEEPEDTLISETTFRLGDNELVVTLEGDYSDPELSLYVPEDTGKEKEALEKAMGVSALNLHVVGLRDADNVPVRIGHDDAAYEEEIPVTVSGSWITEDTELVFALMNEDGTAQIVEVQQGTLDDGTACRRFRADMFLALMICEKGEPLPEEIASEAEAISEEEAVSEAEEPEEEKSEFSAEAEADAPALKAGAGDNMDVTVTIGWEGDEPVKQESRPYVVYVKMERSTDGEKWASYEQDLPFAIASNRGWQQTFTLPAKDAAGNPYTYRITESDEGLGRYLLPDEAVEVTADSTNAAFTNTYNDAWDYSLRLFWDVSSDEGKILQEVQTTARTTQNVTYHIAVNTQQPYKACDDPLNPTSGITVRILPDLLRDRSGNMITPSDISVGTIDDYDPTYYFIYTVDPATGDLVFYNWKDIPKGYNVDIEVQYKLDPMQIEDCTIGQLQAHGEGHYENQPDTDDGKQDSDTIYYRLDTGAEFQSFEKDPGYPLRAVPPSMKASDFDFANYRYMVYILRWKLDGNQPLQDIIFTDRPRSEKGENGRVVAILRPDEKDTRTSSGGNEIHTYSRPAISLSTPSGDPVNFTTEFTTEGAVARWSEKYNLLRKDENGNYANYGEQCYYLIVRYDPVKDKDGYIIEDMLYHNDEATASLEVADPQHPVDVREVNDFKDTDEKTVTATGHWEPDAIPPEGPGPYFADKRLGDNMYPGLYAGFTRLKYGLFHVYSATTHFNVVGKNLNGNYYYADWYDDDVYMRGYYDAGDGEKWHEYRKLGKDDYQIWYTLKGSTYFEVTAYDTDPVTGQHIPETGVFTIQVKTSKGEWVDYDTFTLDSTGYAMVTPDPYGENGLSTKGYTGIRVRTPEGMTANLRMTMNVWYIINGNSPVARDLLDNMGATDLQIMNHSTNDLYTSPAEDGPYKLWNLETPGTMPPEEYDRIAATGVGNEPEERIGIPDGYFHCYRSWGNFPKHETQNVAIEKKVLGEENHQNSHSFSHQWSITAFEYFNTASIPREVLHEMEFSADESVFYDLLPPGYHLDETRSIEVGGANGTHDLDAGYPASVESYTIQRNFRDTGRDLVTFVVKSERDSFDNLFIRNYTYTGFTIRFWTTVSYYDVEEESVNNLCMYQRSDKRAMIGSVAYDDERGYGVDPGKYMVNGEFVMKDLDGDHIPQPNSAMYFSTPVKPSTVETLQDGLYKFVSGNSGVWGTEDQTDLEGIYHYQILMETANTGEVSDVVLYDVLEEAANTDQHTGEADGWKGVLQSVDVSRARALGVDPVVYYTTEKVSYNDKQPEITKDWADSLTVRQEIWKTEMPEDPSKITAVAFDLRWKDAANKVPFTFKRANRVGVELNMKAPDKVPSSPYAYNRPAFHSILTGDTGTNPDEKFNISSRTVIKLRDLQNFRLFKYYETGDEDGKPVKAGLGGVTFELYQCTNDDEGHVHTGMPGEDGSCWGAPILTKTSLSNGMVEFTSLDTGEYAVIESAIPSRPVGLKKLDNRWWTFSVDVDAQQNKISEPEAHSTDETAYPIVGLEWDGTQGCYTLENELPVFSISVEKSWNGTVPYGDTLTFVLYKDKETKPFATKTVTIPETSPWTFKSLFTGLSRYDDEGKLITYRLEELSKAGYEITEPTDGSVTFTAPETGDHLEKFTNSRLGWLEIAKIMTDGDPEIEFSFTVEIIPRGLPVEDGTEFHYYKYAAGDITRRNPSEGSVSAVNGEMTVSLKAGEVIRFYDLPADGSEYIVTENEDVEGYHLVSWKEVRGRTSSDLIPQAEFTNAKDGNLQISKKVTSGDKTKGFTVTVTLEKDEVGLKGDYPLTVTGADGKPSKITFKDGTATLEIHDGETWLISNLPAGAKYTVTENGLAAGWIQTSSSNLTGTIVSGETITASLENSYRPSPAEVHFEGVKTLSGRDLMNAEFTFTLTGSDGTKKTVSNAGKKIDFGDIPLAEAGTFTYTVKEDATNKSGVTIDSTQYNITVEVTDNGKGQLEAKVTDGKPDALDFKNIYKPAPVKVHFEGVKTLKGKKLKDAEFSFTLIGSDGKDIETVKNDGKGKISFTEITYDAVGTYNYKVKEEASDEKGVTIDSKVRDITVKVTDDKNGKLVAEVTGGDTGTLKFVNTYKPEPVSLQFKGVKTLNGKTLRNAEFSFTLTGSDGTRETVTNDAGGRISFSEITYDKTGTYTYSVKEEATDEAGVTIDSTVYTYTVEVTDDGSGELKAEVTGADITALNFTNTYNPGVPPKTGDNTPLMLWILILAGSAAAAFVLLKRRKAV